MSDDRKYTPSTNPEQFDLPGMPTPPPPPPQFPNQDDVRRVTPRDQWRPPRQEPDITSQIMMLAEKFGPLLGKFFIPAVQWVKHWMECSLDATSRQTAAIDEIKKEIVKLNHTIAKSMTVKKKRAKKEESE